MYKSVPSFLLNKRYSNIMLIQSIQPKSYFSLLSIHLDEKGPSVKIQLLNIFKDYHIVAKPSPKTVGYDEWPLSIALWTKLYNSHGKYKPELNEYFYMYCCQLNFAIFCATSTLGISWQHLNHPSLLVRSVYRFHVYFHVRLIMHDLVISFPHEDAFSMAKITYIMCVLRYF